LLFYASNIYLKQHTDTLKHTLLQLNNLIFVNCIFLLQKKREREREREKKTLKIDKINKVPLKSSINSKRRSFSVFFFVFF